MDKESHKAKLSRDSDHHTDVYIFLTLQVK